MAIGIGKAVGKLHAIRVIRFKKISKMKLIRCSFLLILMISISVIYFGTSSSPYIFLSLFITDFHSFIIEARTFSKSLDDKFGLPFKSFDYEIKPCRNTIGVEFFCQSYLVCSRSYFLDSLYIARLKITSKNSIPNGYNLRMRRIKLPLFLCTHTK